MFHGFQTEKTMKEKSTKRHWMTHTGPDETVLVDK